MLMSNRKGLSHKFILFTSTILWQYPNPFPACYTTNRYLAPRFFMKLIAMCNQKLGQGRVRNRANHLIKPFCDAKILLEQEI